MVLPVTAGINETDRQSWLEVDDCFQRHSIPVHGDGDGDGDWDWGMGIGGWGWGWGWGCPSRKGHTYPQGTENSCNLLLGNENTYGIVEKR